jgi:hypothetical protein
MGTMAVTAARDYRNNGRKLADLVTSSVQFSNPYFPELSSGE